MKINFLPKLMQASLICCLTFTLTNCGNIDNPLEELNGGGSVSAATITTAPTATTDDIIKGSTTALVTKGVANGGTMMYQVTTENTKPTSTDGFDVAVPTAAALAVGTHYVWYYAKADATHSDSEIAATAIEVMVNRAVVDLSTKTADYEAQDGDVLTGMLGANVKITIADPVAPATTTTVTLNGMTINGVDDSDYQWAGITCVGNATIILKDGSTNTVKGFFQDCPGIFVPDGSTLTIKGGAAGTGKLTASSGGNTSFFGAGIGGGNNIPCGNIEILGGMVTATGGYNGAGIGGGGGVSCGDIVIKGGTVKATGGEYGPGIGSGDNGTCGNIEIQGDKVTANGGKDGAGIGCGFQGSCGTIEILGGTVTANGGEDSAGIGSAYQGSCGTITIANTVTSVTAKNGGSLAENSIGIGYRSSCGAITFGTAQVYDGTSAPGTDTWDASINFAVNGDYGPFSGLTLTISTTTNDNDTWTLTPAP